MKERYFDDAESRDWILSTHAKHAITELQRQMIQRCASAFVLFGNEDCPEGVDFYSTNSPINGESPMISLRINENGYLVEV